jgi:60 kDa SS-A/Ro ribonucleoprotein
MAKPDAQTTELVANSVGGASHEITDAQRFLRFLILGCEGGTYYASQRELGIENVAALLRLLESGQHEVVLDTIRDVSLGGRAAKQQPTMLALAVVLKHGTSDAKKAALALIDEVCRIPTHLFMLLTFARAMDIGWGRSYKRAVSHWYTSKDADRLAFLVTKYQRREGWSHRDVLRLCHMKPQDPAHALVYQGIVKGASTVATSDRPDDSQADVQSIYDLYHALHTLNTLSQDADAVASNTQQAIDLVRTHRLAHEHVPTPFLGQTHMWAALLETMPVTATMRNLARMTTLGVFKEYPGMVDVVCSRLTDQAALRKARLHPLNALVAQRTYSSGKGMRGSNTWEPIRQISTALEEAFYASFGNVEPTGKRLLLAVDVSGSMTWGFVRGCDGINAREAAAAMAMVALRTEQNAQILGFSHTLVPIPVTAEDSLDVVLGKINKILMGGTDCALPMRHAIDNDLAIDAFVVYTDNETYTPNGMPSDVLRAYRHKTGIDAKLVVAGMTATGFTIADPSDPGMLDLVGFDTNAPTIMSDFIAGKL